MDDLQVHHIQSRSRPGDETAENLITLCASCHQKAHGQRYLPLQMVLPIFKYHLDPIVTGSVIRECATEAPISAHRSKSKFGPPLVLPKRWGGQLIRNPRTRKPDQKAKHEQQLFHDQYPALVVLDNFFYH